MSSKKLSFCLAVLVRIFDKSFASSDIPLVFYKYFFKGHSTAFNNNNNSKRTSVVILRLGISLGNKNV